MAKMKCPENCGSCAVGGQEYTANKKGIVEIPEEYVAALFDHGYVLAVDEPKQAKTDTADVQDA